MTQLDPNAIDKTFDTLQLHELLQQTRQAQHLTLETVSSQLNISVEQLQFLESDGLDPLNLTPFERGYVRNYAALLQIPREKYEYFFPQNKDMASQLHSVNRYYSFEDSKPFFSRPLGRALIYVLVLGMIGAVLWLLWPQAGLNTAAEQADLRLQAPNPAVIEPLPPLSE
ncbi:MAG: helix-turn-helix domain-containing protein [Thiotrichales bacterium]|nr:helix-turn-helix domain-containing protein [Thiotrichales bacterium]